MLLAIRIACAALVLTCSFASATHAALPPGFSEENVDRPDGQAWAEAVGVAFSKSGRLFVWERDGSVWIVDPTSPNTTRFLDLRNEVAAYRDHGMLGFALHPDFENTGYVYAQYVVERHHLVNCDSPRNGPPVCGTGYLPGTHQPFNATIGRIVRYRALPRAGEAEFHHAVAIDPNSRSVLYGESYWLSDPNQFDLTKPRNSGCPILHESHGVGSLVFGQDGTLFASCGDGASDLGLDLGSFASTYQVQALADGIITPKENVGAYRSQLVDSFSGKIIRIDPDTGDGIDSNPFYASAQPRSAQSRVWALGLRNPFRFTLRPGTGRYNPADGNPGILYVGDVGWDTYEDLNVVRPGGQNFGWPAFEGHDVLSSYYNENVENLDAPNPLYNGTTCTRRYFYFRELIKQDTLGTPSWPNPCNSSVQITSADVFLHSRPALDWEHAQTSARFAAYNGKTAVAQPIGTTAPDGSTVLGSAFFGNTSAGGVWYIGTLFPKQYQNTYFHGDYGARWIKNFVFDSHDVLQEARSFGDNVGGVVSITMHPVTGELYYIASSTFVRRIGYTQTTSVLPTATVTVSDGQATASSNLLPTVTAVEEPPTISSVADQTTSAGVAVGPLAVTVGDVDTAPASLTLSGGTSNAALVPVGNIVFGGTGTARTVMVTPVAGQTGSATITMTVSDGQATASSSFLLTVTATPVAPLAFAQSKGAFVDASGTTLTVQLTNVQAGSLLVAYVKWEGTAASTVTLSDGTSAFTADTLNSAANNDLHGRFYYLLSSSASGTVNYTATWSAARPYRKLLIYEYRYGGTVSFDASSRATATAGSLASGNLTATGTDEVVFGAYGEYGTSNTTNEQINGVVADQVLRANFASMWSKRFSSPFTGSATATGNSTPWIGNAIAFKRNTAPNTAPTISALGPQTIAEDLGTGALPFTVGDAETAAGSLTLSRGTTNATLVPVGNIVFGGSGANRTVTVTPAANQSGTATIAVTVSDGQATASSNLLLTVTAVNDPPTISSVADQTTSAGVAVGPLAVTVGDVDTAPASLTLSGGTSNAALVPVGNIVFGGTGTARTVTVTPVAGQTGSATITMTVSDGQATASSSFLLTVTAPNTAPTISALGPQTIAEDLGTGALPFTVGDAETAAGSLTLSRGTTNATLVPVGNIVFGGSGANRTVTVTPAANQSGTATIAVTVSDGQATASSNLLLTVTAVNDPPTISSVADQTTSAGVAVGPLAVTVGDVDTAPASLTLSGGTSNAALVPVGNIVFGGTGTARTVMVTPVAGQTGSATITMTVSDGQATASSSFLLTVTATPVAPLAFAQSKGAFVDASGTTLTVQLTNVQAGSLLVAYVKWEGTAASTVTLSDGTSAFTADTLNSAANNDLHGRFYYLLSSSASGTVNYTATWSAARPYRKLLIYEYRYGGTVSFDASSRATATAGSLASGNLTATGTDEVVFGAYGEYGTSNTTNEQINGVVADQVLRANFASMWSKRFSSPFTGSATATGNSTPWIGNAIAFKRNTAPNTAPTISALGPQTIAEDLGTGALPFTVGDAETAAGSLTLSRGTTNATLVPVGNIVFGGSGANRTVTVTPAANQSGTATIAVTVSDGQATASSNLLLTVTAVNDPPTISSVADQTTSAGVAVGPLAVTVGDVDTAPASLTLSGGTSNAALVPVGNIVFGGTGTARTVTVTPVAGQTGSATITMTVSDGQATASSSFLLTVTAPNTAPTISALGPQTIAEDLGTGALPFTVGDAETAAGSLTLSRGTTNATLVPVGNIVFGGSGANRTVTVTPAANQSGTATIAVTVSDGQATASSNLLLTVTAVNDPPTISSVADQTTSAGVAVGPLAVTVGDVDTAPASLTLSGGTSNAALVPVGNIVFGGTGTARTVTVTPVAGQTGSATITMTVSDGQATASSSFLLTVTATPVAPLAFAQSKGAFVDASGTTLTVQLTNVQAGSLLVAYVKWEGTAASTVTLSDGTSAFTADTLNSAANNDLHGRFYYLLSSSASGTVNYTATWSAARPYRKLLIYEYRYGGTVSFDASSRATATAGSLASGNLTATGTDEVVFGAYGEYGTSNTTNEQINGVVADQVLRANFASMWSKRFSSPFTGSATATGNSTPWIGNAIAFKRSNGTPDAVPPTPPSGLAASAVSAFQVDLSWSASTDNIGVTAYRVERCEGAGCNNFVQVLVPTGTSASDTGVAPSTSYTYRVRAADAAGNLSPYSGPASTTTSPSNPIEIENRLPGSSAWQLGDLYGRPYATDAVGQIKGYASATSVNKGESITFHVSVNTAQTYTIDVYRIGWYQGLGGRLMQQVGPLSGVTQPACPTNASTGMIECNWTPSYTLNTQASWTSGIYLAVLRNAQGFYSYMVFAVRDDSRVGALLYQQPVTTYQAYNAYPEGTGKSLYEHNSNGAATVAGTTRAVKVSFDRPYNGSGAGQLLEVSEINTLRWMEKSGYDVTYSTDVDTHRDGARLFNHRGFLSLPHDEYWSKPMYDAAIAARDAGVNLAFFGANSVFWQVRFEPSSGGAAHRTLVCYKDAALDPVTDPSLKTVKWRDGPVNRPEQTLVGVQFTDGPNSGTASYVVANSGNWVYAGTGFVDGAIVPGIVWYEADRLVSGDPPPVAVSGTYTLLSQSPYVGSGNNQDHSNSSIYQAPSGAWVFASGTMGWGRGLDDFYPEGSLNTVDPRIQRATANVLDRFVGP